MPSDSRSKTATRKKKVRIDVASAVATVAAEYPACFASFEGAVIVELVGKALGLADERVFGTLDEVKDIVGYLALELLGANRAPLSFVRAAADVHVVFKIG
eukprot:6180121-Pleurochrysis_carterae.AAC.1